MIYKIPNRCFLCHIFFWHSLYNKEAFSNNTKIINTFILIFRCDGKKKCVVPVNSDLFHDACPGTHKYLEIHYACLSSNNQKVKPGGRLPPIKPGWVPVPPPPSGSSRPSVNTNITYDNDVRQTNENNNKRKPILVTEKVETTSVRVPITTPRPTTSSTTTTTASTMTSTTSSTVKRTSKRPTQSTRKPTPVYPTTKDLGRIFHDTNLF